MPSLTVRIPNLQQRGAIIETLIAPSSVLREVLQKENKQIPKPIPARMLIDTGASISAIKKGFAERLSLKLHDITKIATPSNGAYRCPLYDIDILFPAHQVAIKNVGVIEATLEGQDIDGLIGRNILKLGLFIYTGYDNSFTIAF